MGYEEYVYSLRQASMFDLAAAEVQRLSNQLTRQQLLDARREGTIVADDVIADAPDLTPDQASQRKAILTISVKLLYSERDKHLRKLQRHLNGTAAPS